VFHINLQSPLAAVKKQSMNFALWQNSRVKQINYLSVGSNFHADLHSPLCGGKITTDEFCLMAKFARETDKLPIGRK
jgi:hypothetical protein